MDRADMLSTTPIRTVTQLADIKLGIAEAREALRAGDNAVAAFLLGVDRERVDAVAVNSPAL